MLDDVATTKFKKDFKKVKKQGKGYRNWITLYMKH